MTLEAARRGDRGSQATLLRALQDRWFRFCLSLLGNSEDARDAVQETALRFLRELPKFRGQSSITTWSMGIAINVTREIRRKGRSLQTATRDPAIDPEQSVVLDESRSKVRAVLDELPERQREALLLRYFEELSVEETAAAMGCATGTVKATVHQALRTLKTKLKQLA